MAKSKQGRYETAKDSLKEDEDIDSTDKDLILEFLHANDPNRHTYEMPDSKTKAPSTLSRYTRSLTMLSKDLDSSLSDSTPLELNTLMDRYLNGEVEGTKDEGLSNNTVRNRQTALRRFYYYYDFETDREDINLVEQKHTSVDERDMFTKEEVQRIRDVAKSRGTRDSCIVDLLLYTGQRISALLGLRLKDIDEDNGVFYLNEDAGDLKGANGKRPLLGAEKSTTDWKRQHPTGEPEDFLLTAMKRRNYQDRVTLGDKLSYPTVYEILQNIGRESEVEKPVNAHNFRHYFVTTCKKQYGMDNDTIKFLIGHDEDSNVMESTYSHLTDEDYIRDAEEKYGIREPENESPLTPATCDRCNEPLEGDWRTCPYCNLTYAPDVHQKREEVEESQWKEKSEAQPGSEIDQSVDDLRKLLKENPDLVDELVN